MNGSGEEQERTRQAPPPADRSCDDYAAAIVASTDTIVIATDLAGVIRFWNAAAATAYGYAAAEVLGRLVDVIVPESERAAAAHVRSRVARGERIDLSHVWRVRKDGAVIERAVVVSPVRSPDGAIVGVSELAHVVATPSLREEAASRLAAIIESSDDAIVSKDLNGIVKTWNHSAEKMFGYRAEEMIGRSITTIIPAERLGEEDVVLSKIRAGEMVDHFETVRQRKDGSLLDVSLTVSPVRTGDGRIVGASKIARDISERKRLVEAQRHLAEHEQRTRRETLESENRRIREAARVKSEFVANVSHELRTPLQSIIGFTEVLIDERLGSVPEQYREVGGLVLASSQHLLQLINDILDLAKLESGNIEFEPEPVDLKSLVDEVYAIVSGLATHSGITVEREVDPRLSVAYADPAKLKQVFYNYLSNAIKFTAEGGRVSIRLSPEGNDAFRIEVEDTGIGVAVEAQDRLFVEFQQLDPGTSKRYQGTGLGLALTKRIVAAQGGSVGFRSRHGEGGTFFAILPLIMSPKSADITSRADRAHLEPEGR